MEIPKRLLDFLEQTKVDYEVLEHPEAPTAQELAALEHVKGRYHAKVVMVRAENELVMTIVPSDRRVDLDKLEGVLGKPVALATEDEFKELFPDCSVGRMPPFGNLYGLPMYIDKSFQEGDFIVFEAGTPNESIKMNYQEFQCLAESKIADFTVKLT